MRALLVCLIVSLLQPIRSSPDCAAQGFQLDLLPCESCSLLKDQDLLQECKACCTHAVLYKGAVLEVCPMKLGRLPEIQQFIEKVAPKYSRVLKLRQTLNAQPRLKLTREDGTKTTDTIRIDHWKKAALQEFMEDRMVKTSS